MRTFKKLIVAVYNDERKAEEEFKILSKKEKKDELDLKAYTVISKKENGKTVLHDTEGRDAFWGAIIGGLIGMIVGVVGAIYGATLFSTEIFAGSVVALASVGAIVGWINSDALKIPTDLLTDIKMLLNPKTSAIVAVVDDDWVDEVEEILEGGSEMIHHYQFSDSVVEKFEKDWEDHDKIDQATS